jgi:pectate lyase
MTTKLNSYADGHCFKALVVLLINLALLPPTHAALLFYESFDYPIGQRLGDAGSSATWENVKDYATIAADSLSYSGLAAAAGNRASIAATTVSFDGVRTKSGAWPSQTNGALYVSFLLRVASAAGVATTGDGTSLLTVSRPANNTQLLGLGLLDNGGLKLGVLKYPSSSTSVSSAFFSSGAGANLAADGTTVYFVVAKYEWVAGAANDIVTAWVNPSQLGGAEDPGNQVSTSVGTDGTQSAGRFTISRGASFSIDELRIGQTWGEVTPTGGVTVTPQPQPVITQAFVAPAGFVMRGTNGPANTAFAVLASPNLTVPAEQWPVVNTNTFDGAGHFDVTNTLPSDAAQFYRVKVGGGVIPGATAPTISVEPVDRTVLAGQSTTFTVTASGTAPLSYQWYFNTNTPLAGADSNSWTVGNAQLANQGAYHVVVTNPAGAVTSAVARLTIATLPPAGSAEGYATLNGGTTGGAAGPTVTVSTLEDLEFYLDDEAGPCTILIQGTINLGGSNVRVRDNKTIIGLGTDATLVGDLKVDGNNNVIIRNLTFTNPNGAGDKDGLTLQDCRNVWVDHCTFVDCDDGSVDISHGADWITVSWCHFYYTNPANDHRFSNLVGHSDSATAVAEDTGKLHVTFHHNWWGQLVHERMPRVRFGRVHVYNNFYNSPGNNNCIRAARDSEILVENNYFDSVKNVWERYVTVGLDGKVFASNNIEVNTTWSAGSDSSSVQIPGTDVLSAEANGLNLPPYGYTLDPAAGIPNSVTNNAGAGKGPFAP